MLIFRLLGDAPKLSLKLGGLIGVLGLAGLGNDDDS
jgi:hypothetical protein